MEDLWHSDTMPCVSPGRYHILLKAKDEGKVHRGLTTWYSKYVLHKTSFLLPETENYTHTHTHTHTHTPGVTASEI